MTAVLRHGQAREGKPERKVGRHVRRTGDMAHGERGKEGGG